MNLTFLLLAASHRIDFFTGLDRQFVRGEQNGAQCECSRRFHVTPVACF